MDWEGGCLCGAVRYRSSEGPIRAVSCHCAMCRRWTGAAFATFVHFPAGTFVWEVGQPTRYRSSAEAERGFCARCGSTLTMHEAVLPDRVQVALCIKPAKTVHDVEQFDAGFIRHTYR